jgi:hypothetical protein
MVDAHYGWSMAALTVLVLLGIASFFELWRYGKVGRLSNDMLNLVARACHRDAWVMIVCGELGWDINHIELRAVLQRPRAPPPRATSLITPRHRRPGRIST